MVAKYQVHLALHCLRHDAIGEIVCEQHSLEHSAGGGLSDRYRYPSCFRSTAPAGGLVTGIATLPCLRSMAPAGGLVTGIATPPVSGARRRRGLSDRYRYPSCFRSTAPAGGLVTGIATLSCLRSTAPAGGLVTGIATPLVSPSSTLGLVHPMAEIITITLTRAGPGGGVEQHPSGFWHTCSHIFFHMWSEFQTQVTPGHQVTSSDLRKSLNARHSYTE